MQAFHCHKCGERITMEDVDSGRVVRYEGNLYCAKCGKELSKSLRQEPLPEEDIYEITPLPQGDMVCSRCKAPISKEQLLSGEAIMGEDGRAYCPTCTRLVMPLYEALKKSASDTTEEDAPLVEPASEITTAPYRPPPSLYAGQPQKKSYTPIILILIAAFILLVIIIAASSGGKRPEETQPTPPPTPPIATPLPPGPVTPTPPVEDSKELQENTRKLRDSIDAIMRRWASDRDHETALSQLEALKEMKVLPDAYYLLPDAIRRIEAARDEDGRRAYESIRAEVEHHLGRGDYAAARKAVERFPEKLRLAGDWWQKTKELLAQIERSEKAKGRFSSLNENVERLLLEQKLNEAKQVLKEAEAELKDTPYEEHLKRLVAEVDRKIEEMEKKRQEEEEAKRKMLEAMRNQTPLFFADFSKGKIEGTFRVVLKDCGFPALVPGDAPSRPNAVRFLKTDSTSVVELQFKLPKPPLSGLLTLKQFLPPPPQNMAALTSEIELFLNEKSIEKRLLSGQPQGGEFTAEFELRELKAGENTIKITHTGGIHRYFLIGVELRLALPQDVLSALKETVEKEKESITKANADFLHQYSEGALLKWKASIDKDGGKPPKKNEWEPLFDGATLRFWHPLDNYAEWRVEGGSIVCVNKSNQWSSLEPYIKKMYDWLEYDLKYEIVHEGQGYGGVEFFVQYMTDFGGPRGSVRFGAMEPNIAQQVTGKRFSMLVEVRENRLVFFVNGQKMESEGRPPEGHKGIGYFCLLAGPNSTVRFKDVQIKLYKTK